jgi:hypothetical protein
MPLRILLNYRRGDTAGSAGRLYEALSKRFGEENVFMDIDKIEPGLNFVEVIKRWVGSCDVFLAMIGQHWLTAADQWGQRRLDDPEDFVRLELEEALARPDVRVIPVLVQDVDMPSKAQLPPSLQEFALRNGLEIRDVSWGYDVDRLIEALEKIEGPQPAQPGDPGQPRRPDDGDGGPGGLDPKKIAIGLGAALLIGAVILGVLLLRDGDGSNDGSGGSSTNSERLVFAEGGDLFTVGTDGADQPLTGTGVDHQPDWSPDGTRLAVARASDIVVLDASGRKQRDVTKGEAVDDAPSWSPDGARIAFNRIESPGSRPDVWVVGADGSNPRNLTKGSRGAQPDWSPDGRIVFQRLGAMFSIRTDGTDERLLLDVEGDVHEPAWSPDGSQIAFALVGGTDPGIYVYSVAERTAQSLRRTTEPSFPAWSEDGDRLVFADADGIWTIDRDGGALEQLRRGGDPEAPSFQPGEG